MDLTAVGKKLSQDTKDAIGAALAMHKDAIADHKTAMKACRAALTDMTDTMQAALDTHKGAIKKHQEAMASMQDMMGGAVTAPDDDEEKTESQDEKDKEIEGARFDVPLADIFS